MENKVFEDIVHLLQGADWLYNYPMTQVFTRNIFTHMPVEWQKALTDLPLDVLNGLPQCLTQDQWPSSLKVFLQECQRLSCLSPDLGPQTSGGSRRGSSSSNVSGSSSSSSSSSNLQIPQELTYGLTVKKKHEITTLLSIVKEMLDLTGSKHILDIGSGKGYIDSCIHRILHAQVLGVEGNCKLMRSAEKHHWKLYGRCRGITFLNWYLSDNTETLCRAEQLVSYLTELDTTCSCQTSPKRGTSSAKVASKTVSSSNIDGRESKSSNHECSDSPDSFTDSESSMGNGSVCSENRCVLLGLHACADLSPIIIKVFRDCVQASSLVLLSCCYHKMSLRPKAADDPASDKQESQCKGSDDTEGHEGLTLRKLRRRCVRKSGFEDFSEYKRNIFDNYEFQKTGSDGTPMESVPNSESTLNMNEDKILERNTHISATLDTCFENHKHYFPLIEPLTGLQLALQPVIEILVQMDRLIYLKECGFSRVWLEKVFDAEVSPRNIALLAVR
ncbi:hypothetical protein O3P69_007534 [Scylla paramamosain]|uniref:Methyltransferase domain-containing protein n=1 Tax=Scylla paramamosain TaxID=85552 RepID=A0AAW0UVW8_SCYPA